MKKIVMIGLGIIIIIVMGDELNVRELLVIDTNKYNITLLPSRSEIIT